MKLTVSVTHYRGVRPETGLSTEFGEQSFTIGRGPKNDFLLPDPDRIISHQHALIHFENGAYYLSDTSTNGTFLNHSLDPVGPSRRPQLHDGDVLSIGEYECRISITDPATADPVAGVVPSEPTPLSRTGAQADQVPVQRPAEIPDDFWENQNAPPHPPVPEPVEPEGFANSDALIPADFDFLSPVDTSPRSEQNGLGYPGDHAAPEQQWFRPPDPVAESPAIDATDRRADARVAPVDSTSNSLAQPAMSGTLGNKPASHLPAGQAVTGENSAVQAFLAGAGLAHTNIQADDAARILDLGGQLVREMTEGLMQLLTSRSNIKGEFRLDRTQVRPVENNPIKFSLDAHDAISKLLLPESGRGYLPPVDATHEAISDLLAHQLAVLAGFRGVLNALVAHLDPDAVEKKTEESSVLENLLPGSKEAKYWKLFKKAYNQVAADAENDFLHLFGKEFADAYDQQLAALSKKF
ncbi:MAG: type VI secretion system-associated FHA domain protein TagH [Gammaproteobacteria bacterium]|nr:type VI secretion system-associated FHA domain protein TagH [Gammaproteobacteria bacterium]MDH3465214.1 type VI secretion system-associated FHA domain protein TagH [Gammaproteobacteria bacterium]